MSCPPRTRLLAAGATFGELPAPGAGGWQRARARRQASAGPVLPQVGERSLPVSSPAQTGSLHKLV